MHPVLKSVKNLKLNKVPIKHKILNNNKNKEITNKNIISFTISKFFSVPTIEITTEYKFLQAIIPNANGNIYFLNSNVLSTKNKQHNIKNIGIKDTKVLVILENFKVVINVLKIFNIQYAAIKTKPIKCVLDLKIFIISPQNKRYATVMIAYLN